MTSGSGRDLIRHLETKSGWVISYSTRLCIEDNMTLSREQKSLLAHLQDLFANCSFTWVIRDNRIILRPKELSERRFVVNGYVRESPGQESLPYANIFSLQTGTGTTS
ncbi:carboxypeptidase-like regulatory domain-containing protein, partial [Desulfonatronum sp. SC1]|uniref:carboxypeptidase-like regulatory domain-containing protein n=1 Tax=Desulfonatronum sp. SC1 TaxID=2109626 RepID=UPI001E5899B8